MDTKTFLQTAESNYALVRLGTALLALASVQLGVSGLDDSIGNSPVILGYVLFALMLLGISVYSPATSALRTNLSSLADAAFIGCAIILEGSLPLLAASPLLLMAATQSMSRNEQTLAAGYHVLALIIAWATSSWHLAPLLQLGAAIYVAATVAYTVHLGIRQEQAHRPQAGEVLIPVPPTSDTHSPELLYNPDIAEPPQTTETRLQASLLLGNASESQDLVKLLNGWGAALHSSSEVARFIAGSYASAGSKRTEETLIIDVRGRAEDPLDLLSLVRNSERLQPLRCILISDDEAHHNQPEQHGFEGFDAVLYSPLDKTLLFNALHADSTRPAAHSGVTSLLDRYIREKTSLPPLEILVAVSNQVRLKVVKRQLEKGGHRVYTTSSGEQALDAMTAHRFDVAMLDLHLPDMDGIEVTRIYRLTHSRQLSSPIVMLVSEPGIETKQRCEHAGADAVLGLPLQPPQLNSTLGQLLNQPSAPVHSNLFKDSATDAANSNSDELDLFTLRELEHLGNGLPFVQELVDNFIADSNVLIDAMRSAVDEQDLETFRDCAHALKGSAGSVGAAHLQHFCIQLANISIDDFHNNTPLLMSGLVETTHSAHGALLSYINERAEQASRS